MAQKAKITTGPNARPRNETIGQSGEGLPNDSGGSFEVDEKQVARLRHKLGAGGPQPSSQQGNVDEVPQGTTGAGENVCRCCAGTGMIDGRTCPDCNGTGTVTTPIGGG